MTARDDTSSRSTERFPDNPYREQTRKWRDKILLEDAESRAKFLTSGSRSASPNRVTTQNESFVIAHELATRASEPRR